MQGADKGGVDGFVREVGGCEAMQTQIHRRLRRVNNRLVADPPKG